MEKNNKEIIETTLNALERLLKIFQLERVIYLGLTALSFILLLYAAYRIFSGGESDTQAMVSIFGGAGIIASSSARISYFFNRAFNLIERLITDISK